MTPAEPILVIGAGIAGLAAALSLAGRGFAVRVCERAERLEEIGAGLQLSPNALRVLDRLGLVPSLRLSGVEAEDVILRNLGDGRELARVPVRGSDGTPYLSIHRADLQSVLADAASRTQNIDLDLGTSLTALRYIGRETAMVLTHRDGTEEELRPPAAIAADGVRSTLARLLDHPSAHGTGDVAWRLTLAADGSAASGIAAWLGSSCHAVAYPVNGGRSTNLVAILPERVHDPRMALRTSDPRLRAMAERLDDATRWPIAFVDRPRRPGDPANLLLIGDAAHAMPPYAAQGAALAIEDGYVAAACLAEAPSAADAWNRFEVERRSRWARVRRRVAFHRRVYHLPPPFSFARDLALRMKSESSLRAELAWLYDWLPPAG